jgi:tripartite-type tricarboxylate transporter receptor subunit TctC
VNFFSTILRLTAFLALTLINTSHAQTIESFPNRAIKMVVPFGPGSGTDTVARVVAQQMQTYVGKKNQ